MRYYRIFEGFDRYEFGKKITNDMSLHSDYIEIFYNYGTSFSDDEQNEIISIDDDRFTIDIFNTPSLIAFIRIVNTDDRVTYEIFHLGDYCYCICEHRASHVVSIDIIDGFDSLLNAIKIL